MFENLLGQNEIVSALTNDIEGGSLAPSILFSGPPASGKLTAALEVARALSCVLDDAPRAPWNCTCPSCTRHRVLAHPDLLLLGPRTFPEEIAVGLDLLNRSPGSASSFFFIRALRKLTKRFDPVLYEGEESRLAKAAPLLRELDELLEDFASERASPGLNASKDDVLPGAASGTQKTVTSVAQKIATIAAKLEALVPDSIPVFMVRNVEAWARLSPLGSRKTVILENAENMQDAARNAMLKILEEMPESCRFILSTSRRSSIIGTILSRTRTYTFKPRKAEDARLVLERIFKSTGGAESIASFFAACRPFPPETARSYARSFLAAALASRQDAGTLSAPLAALASEAADLGESPVQLAESTLARLYEATKDFGQKDERFSDSFKDFLTALYSILSDLLHRAHPEATVGDTAADRAKLGLDVEGVSLLRRIAELLREAQVGRETLNRNASSVVESLFYAIALGERPESRAFGNGAI